MSKIHGVHSHLGAASVELVFEINDSFNIFLISVKKVIKV